MKKHAIPSLFMLLGLAACQKESTNVKNTTATNLKPGIMKPAVGQLPDVVIMNQVGPNTYQGYFHSSGIQVTFPAYDQVKYSTVVDGIPLYVESMTTCDGASMIRSVNSGTEGNVFSTWVPILGGLPSTGFDIGFDNYMSAWSNWSSMGATGNPPLLSGYLSSSYSQEGHSITFTGKVIKVTTGSGVALTEINYPMPTAQPETQPSGTSTWYFIDPANANINYLFNGKNGVITRAVERDATTLATIGTVTVTGTYTIKNNPVTIHFTGTLIRPDGSYLAFDTTEELD